MTQLPEDKNRTDTRVVIWDVDGTMLSRSMERRFVALLREKGLVSKFSIAARTAATWLSRPTTNRSTIKFCYLRGMTIESIVPIARECLQQQIVPEFYDGILDTIAELHQRNVRQVLLTGAPSFLARPLAGLLKISHVVDCTPVVRNGRFTGHLDGLHPRGDDKVRTIRSFLAHNHYDWEHCVALADHEYDIPLLSSVRRPIACNPTDQLARKAAQSDWPVVRQPIDPAVLVDLIMQR